MFELKFIVVTYIFQSEMVPVKFKIYECVVLVKSINEHSSDLLIETVISKVKTQETCVRGQSCNHLLHAGVFLAIMSEVIRFEVEEFECVVLTKNFSEGSSSL